MGLASARVLSTHDGELENTSIIREAVTRRIREVRAETVVSCDPTAVFFENRYYNHSDHRTAGGSRSTAASPAAATRISSASSSARAFAPKTCSTCG
jgi:LmbE family N-acetylglucosaminyl deacetylase